MVCLGFEPGAAEWKAQTDPLSYGGTPKTGRFDRWISAHFILRQEGIECKQCLGITIKNMSFYHKQLQLKNCLAYFPLSKFFSSSVHRCAN